MKPCLWLLASLLSLAYNPLAIADTVPSTTGKQPLSPATVTKLRSLLSFPEASLNPKMELTMGLDYSTDQGTYLYRESTDYAAQIITARRELTGGLADAARYRFLANLYRRARLSAKANAAFHRTQTLYLLALRRRPDDGAALAGYGQTLESSGQTATAEAFLRKATQIAPKSADVWIALGSVLDDEASSKTEPKTHWEHDAARAYDKAVLLAPQNPAVWAARAGFRTWSVPQFQGKLFSRAGLSDYERAASLSPSDPYAQALVASIDCFTFELAHNIFTSLKAAKMEPPASDRRAELYLRRITTIAQTTCGSQSASAYAARAWVQFEFFYDFKGAQKSLRLALHQNPRQQDAIDYQMHVAAVVRNYPLLAAACRRELRVHPAIRLRLLLADADYYLGQQKPVYWQKAQTQIELAHAAEPNDYAISLGLAVLLLKSGSAAAQSRASLLLDKIAPQVPNRPQAQQTEYDVTRGASSALAGELRPSRQYLGLALQNDPHNHPAKSVLALLPE